MDSVVTCVKSWAVPPFPKKAVLTGKDYGCFDALSMSQEMSASKQTNNSCSFQPTSELMKRKAKKIRTEAKYWLSVRRRRSYWWALLKGGSSANVHWCHQSNQRPHLLLSAASTGRFLSAQHWLTEKGLMRVSTCACLPWWHMYSSSTVCSEQTRQSVWLPGCGFTPPPPHWTFLFVSNGKSDNLSKPTSLILNIPVCFAQAKCLAPRHVCERVLNNYSMLALHCPRGLFLGSR